MNRTILIADDDEISRSILSEIFKKEYSLLIASDGQEAIELLEKHANSIHIVLLDIIMPRKTGIDVVKEMARTGDLHTIPVVLITGSTSKENEKISYDLGVSDIITKPFDPYIVRRRVENVLSLYLHKNELEAMIAIQTDKIHEQNVHLRKINESVIDVLSTVVEFRDLESGYHIQRIRTFVSLLLDKAIEKGYIVLDDMQSKIKIVNASAMHDIGKIGIPDTILLKPGKLTPEEFDLMKNHTLIGCSILSKLAYVNDPEFYRYCYDICRSHHERYDGNGYPDGLKGEEIPFVAQIVSLADVYDALVSERVYKKAYSHEESVQMIYDGECGSFSDKIFDCFREIEADFRECVLKTVEEGELL
jgi:putative two-component system response regulator